ncbi:M48 family metallopeptidase [Mailhella massiliensis]|uniref:M48 family metallopeptidase n=1 Tax=Mailhella massiliensis TaxID=1903261 RepID=A0A921DSV0_9BACT|nr:SprT family zinc-dependent metalloprotease [Mailhella massiliensis]HJD97367.1 M48 family metallopeptidase [Mailhella massiliensis]
MLSCSRRARKARSRQVQEEKLLILPGTGLSFLFQRDGCRTLRMSVMADGTVRVKAPLHLGMEEVFSFMHARLAWVRAKQDFFAAHRGAPAEFRAGASVYYLGRSFTLRTTDAGRNARACLRGTELELPCPLTGHDSEALERAFVRWRLETAKLVLGRRLARLEKYARDVLGDAQAPASLTVRSLKRRWGSCSARGDITLAAQLIALPLPLIDYVLCHELCHLRHMNHSPSFHALLLRLLPDAKSRAARIHIWALEHPR